MKILITLFIVAAVMVSAQTKYDSINKEIAAGYFSRAAEMINEKMMSDSMSDSEKWELVFEKDKMERIRLDFRRTREEVKTALMKYYPDITDQQIDKWENDKHLEMKLIDGEKRYFRNAVPNLFRLNKEAAAVKNAKDGAVNRELDDFLASHIPESIKKIESSDNINGNPVKIGIDYTLKVDADAVPEGEVIRCWLPYPKEDLRRQTDVKLISVNEENYVIADNKYPQRTLYLEKTAKKGEPTVFNMKLEYKSWSEWHNIDPAAIKPYNKNSQLYKDFTSERAPHVVFTKELRELNEKITGEEKNPYAAAKKIFTWINDNIPWASALEYSTIDNISTYCYNNMHGDCGIKTLLFITLCRMNGIPAKWQSGWMLHPVEVNLHDWGEIYLEGYGWVPVDQSFGIQKSDNEEIKYFYLGGMDSYRLIVNEDYSQPLFPAKIYPRSETVDFQRGEVEWRGGNLYFDKWDYFMKTDYSE
jgi:transglutaminase-like putative cysteine protease